MDFDVVIVGLGPTGGTLANLLAINNLSILILEKEASKIVLAKSSATPIATFAIIFAVAGATKIRFGFLASFI